MATTRRAAKPNASKDDLLKFYREMLLIRRFEEKAGQLYGMGLIGGILPTSTSGRRLSSSGSKRRPRTATSG